MHACATRASLRMRMRGCARSRVRRSNAPLRQQYNTTSCRSTAHSKLRLKTCRQKAAAAAAVDSELVSALSSPAARAAPLASVVSLDAAMTRFLLRKSKLHVRHTHCSILITFAVYVRCDLARTGSLQPVCASSNRSAASRFGSQGTGAHRRPRGRCALGALLAACEEVAAEAACAVAKCDQCGCGGRSATGDRSEQTSYGLYACFR